MSDFKLILIRIKTILIHSKPFYGCQHNYFWLFVIYVKYWPTFAGWSFFHFYYQFIFLLWRSCPAMIFSWYWMNQNIPLLITMTMNRMAKAKIKIAIAVHFVPVPVVILLWIFNLVKKMLSLPYHILRLVQMIIPFYTTTALLPHIWIPSGSRLS